MKQETKQMLEAAFWTFAQAFIATLALTISTVKVGHWSELATVVGSAATAGIAAILSLIKSVIVKKVSSTDSIFLTSNDKSKG